MKENNVVIPKALISKTTITVYTHILVDDNGQEYKLYSIRGIAADPDAYTNLLETNKGVAYVNGGHMYTKTFEQLGVSTLEEAIDKFKRSYTSYGRYFQQEDPKIAYDEYYKNLQPSSFTSPVSEYSSAYTISEGTADDHSFEYKTYNEDGTVTSSYYKIEVRHPELVSGSNPDSHVTWQEVSAPAEGAELPADTIAVKLPNDVTKYYQYTYNQPADYTVKTETLNLDDATVPDVVVPDNDNHYIFEGGAGQKVQADETVTIENILFKDNSVSKTNMPRYTDISGGALYNAGEITKLTADFVNNSISDSISNHGSYNVYGGAISNTNTIEEITGNFINNSISTNINPGNIYANTYGGAISNTGIIGNINADFINNSVSGNGKQGLSHCYGGAIYNNGTMGNITGNFINNSSTYEGGAIYNAENATIGDITGDFINNSASSGGGAIYNNHGVIGNITGDFVNNKHNGVIYNFGGKIGNITGDFIMNSQSLYSYGVIYNNGGVIGNVTGDFINNSGRGIDNIGTIGDVTGDFINNSIIGSYNDGGAIDNSGLIGNITGDFINNSSNACGGAINNGGHGIASITGNFIGNYSGEVEGNFAGGGAIYTHGLIGDVTGNFINNHAEKRGGAIYVNRWGSVGNIKGNFIGNIAESGGAIYNEVRIGDITGDFINNSTSSYGGAIYNFGRTGNITGNFINNHAMGDGGVIENSGTMGNITGDFYGNSVTAAEDASGGAIDNWGEIGIINGNFTKNSVKIDTGIANGGAINNNGYGFIDGINGDFIGNSVSVKTGSANGGAICNNESELYAEGAIGAINGSFIKNSVSVETGTANGGAIWTNRNMTLTATDGITSVISGNYVSDQEGVRDEAIYIDYRNIAEDIGRVLVVGEPYEKYPDKIKTVNTTFTFDVKNNAKLIVNDKIVGNNAKTSVQGIRYYDSKLESEYQYIKYDEESGTYVKIDTPEPSKIEANNKLSITGDASGMVYLNNDIKYLDIDLAETNLYLGRDTVLNNNNLTLNSGFMSMINGQVGVSALNKLTVNSDTNFAADVDLANHEMDRFTANEYGTHTGNLNVVGMNLLTDANQNEDVTAIYFAEPGLKNNVVNALGELPQNQYQNFEVFTPIYKYNLVYDKENQYDGKGDGGYFLFTKGDKYFRPSDLDPENPTTPITPGGSTGNASDAFNPAVLSSPVSNVAAAQATVNETFKYVFEHADAFTQLPQIERISQMEANKYALSTDYNENLDLHDHGSLCFDHNNKAAWVRPYTTIETMNLKNGPKVDAITYGTLVGYDGDFKEMKNGWHRIGTGYLGYNGSQLSYKGNDTSMNGGLIGLTETFYKGNFWTALTASAGASVGETTTMYGKEDFTTLLAGIGSKTGYNFEFKEGKFIVQPIMFMSYTFVNTFDYTNAAGVKIDSDPAHSIQLNPSVRFISNLKNGWQPYASVGMVWNVMNNSSVNANGVKLPEMTQKPYVEYGVGVQRNWKDEFTAFGQAMVRNGGRNGIALTAGFRWALGKKDKHNNEQVYRPEKKVIKKASL